MARKTKVQLSSLAYVAYNPRAIDEKKFGRLVNSVKEYSATLADWDLAKGYRLAATVTVNRQGNRVVGGEQRIKVLHSLGQGWIHANDITWVDIEPGSALETALCVELNNREAQGEFTDDLPALIAELSSQIPDKADALGLTALLDSISGDTAVTDPHTPNPAEDNIPEAKDPPASQPGELYQLGDHRLLCDDSRRAENLERLMDGDKASLLLTDPPYNVDYQGHKKPRLAIENDAMDERSFRYFLLNCLEAANQVMKPGAAFYIWHADSSSNVFRTVCRDVGWPIRQCLIWTKHHFVISRQDYHWQHEPCLYGWKDGSHVWNGGRKQTTLITCDKPLQSEDHPTMKPVRLFLRQIMNSSNNGDTILDIFGGSGPTAIAAERSARCARIIELDPRYADVIRRRWAEFVHGEYCDWEALTPAV